MTNWELIRGLFFFGAIAAIAGSAGAWLIYKLFLKNAQLKTIFTPDWKEITQYFFDAEEKRMIDKRSEYLGGMRDLLIKQSEIFPKGIDSDQMFELIKKANDLVVGFGYFTVTKGETTGTDIIIFKSKT